MKRDLMIPKVTFRVRTGDEVETDGGCAIGGQWLNKTTEDFFKGGERVPFGGKQLLGAAHVVLTQPRKVIS